MQLRATPGKENSPQYMVIVRPMQKGPEKLQRYAPTKGNQEKTDRIIDVTDIIEKKLHILTDILNILKKWDIQ